MENFNDQAQSAPGSHTWGTWPHRPAELSSRVGPEEQLCAFEDSGLGSAFCPYFFRRVSMSKSRPRVQQEIPGHLAALGLRGWQRPFDKCERHYQKHFLHLLDILHLRGSAKDEAVHISAASIKLSRTFPSPHPYCQLRINKILSSSCNFSSFSYSDTLLSVSDITV